MSEDDSVNADDVVGRGEPSMRIFIFKSDASPDLRAFGGDLIGSRLPKQFKPWRAVGAIAPEPGPAAQFFARCDRSCDQGQRLSALAAEQKSRGQRLRRRSRRTTRGPMHEGVSAMSDAIHKFKVGQTVDLIHSTFRSAARGPTKSSACGRRKTEIPQYRIKSKSEAHERVVSENDLILSAHLKFDD